LKNHILLKCGFVSIFCLISLSSFSQDKITLSGNVQDAVSHKMLKYATVSIQKTKDSSKVAFALTNDKGEFEFKGLPSSVHYRVLFFYSGYEVVKIPLYAEEDIILDTVQMIPTIRTLDEFIVAAERPPLIIRNDTMEFDASAFKTLPNALVEDLLAKLPGVDMDENGQLMVNGKKVSKLLVDGKQFFGSDPSIAFKNLPADAIDKVQVTTESELDKDNGGEESEDEEVVINLTIKKGMKKGYFGKLYAGGGAITDRSSLHELGGIVNVFRDTLQVSFIGFGNNTNKQAFSFQDLQAVGGMDRSGANSWSTGNEGVNIGGVSLGGATDGRNTAKGGGVNINHNLERSYLNVQYFYGENQRELSQNNFVATSYIDSVVNTNSASNTSKFFQSHLAKTRWEFTKDTLTKWTISVQGSLKRKDNENNSNSIIVTDTSRLNESNSKAISDRDESSISTNWSHRKTSKNKKWSSTNYFGISRNETGNINLTNNLVDYFANNIPIGVELAEQERQANDKSQMGYVNWYLKRQFSDSLSLGVHNHFMYDDLNQENRTLTNDGSGYIFNSALSNVLDRQGYVYQFRPYMSYKFGKFTLDASLNWYRFDKDYTYNTLVNEVNIKGNRVLPKVALKYKSARLSYNKEVKLPEDRDLNPLIDNSSPRYTRLGNANVQPSDKHNTNLYVNKYLPKSKLYYYVYASLDVTENPVIYSRDFDGGVIKDSAVNYGRKVENYLGGQVKKTFDFINKNKLDVKLSGWTNNGISPILINGEEYEFRSLNISPNLTVDFNIKDKFVISQRAGYSYRNNSTEGQAAIRSDGYTSSTALLLRWPKRFVWRTSLDVNILKSGYATLPSNTYKLWSAEVFYDIIKDGKLQLNLKAFDLLNQNQSVNSWSQGNQLSINESNVLRQYYMVSLIYNLKAFKAKKVEARSGNSWWW
jgi:hypothetical protein